MTQKPVMPLTNRTAAQIQREFDAEMLEYDRLIEQAEEIIRRAFRSTTIVMSPSPKYTLTQYERVCTF